MILENKRILLGVTGGIAIYKILDLCSRLKKKGATLDIIMTQAATEFVQPLTFETMGRTKVHVDMFHKGSHEMVEHIELVTGIDAFLVAPATANIIAKSAHGLADDLLSSAILAYAGPVIYAPAMNVHMLNNPATQDNIKLLKTRGHHFLDAKEGMLACNTSGQGRLAEPEEIVGVLEDYFTKQDLAGKKILVTAGPTKEMIDPVRYLTNESSGKMGYALAERARARGAEVLLISGPSSLETKVSRQWIRSTQELEEAVLTNLPNYDVLIMAAAPSDYRVDHRASNKIKSKQEQMPLNLVKNKDILQEVSKIKENKHIIIGFAAETENLLENAEQKRREKRLDYIIANDVSKKDRGFHVDTNAVTILSGTGRKKLGLRSKLDLADDILDLLLD